MDKYNIERNHHERRVQPRITQHKLPTSLWVPPAHHSTLIIHKNLCIIWIDVRVCVSALIARFQRCHRPNELFGIIARTSDCASGFDVAYIIRIMRRARWIGWRRVHRVQCLRNIKMQLVAGPHCRQTFERLARPCRRRIVSRRRV